MSRIEMQKEVEIVRLTNLLNESANMYYNGLTPTLSDVEYDNFLSKLEELEKETGYQLDNSPTKRVGFTVLDSIPKKVLPKSMLSLDKVKNDVNALKSWIKNNQVVMSLKLDGLSCMLEYVEGVLVGCYTRGNGIEGSNVTGMVKSLPSVPNVLEEKISMLVIGEVIIRKHNFDRVNEQRVKNGESLFANPRNLASGTLLSLDTSLGKERGLEFVAFDRYCDEIENQIDKVQILEAYGFMVAPSVLLEGRNEKYEEVIEYYRLLASEMGLPIDGVVFAYNDYYVRAKCKPTDKYPTSSIAYKFEDEYEETVLRDIEWSISRNGVLTPVAIFDTVELDGTEVSRANLHNVSILRALELGIGDTIKVVKANQIIPQVVENMTRSDEYELPKNCPHCGSKTETVGDTSLELICTNKNCTERQLLEINHFLSKDALNAKGISEKILKKLISFREVANLYDVLELPSKREYLIKRNYPTLGRKTINNICDSIETACNTTLDRFLIGLGIDGVGKKVAKDIAKKYSTIDNLMNNISIKGLRLLEGIDATAESIYNSLVENSSHIEELLKYVKFEEVESETKSGNSLEGKTFVFTGKTIEFKNRSECENFVISNGGKMSGSVSAKTNYLICNGVENSSKYKKATELGIPIITEKELLEMVK